jgi:hypothetical protein
MPTAAAKQGELTDRFVTHLGGTGHVARPTEVAARLAGRRWASDVSRPRRIGPFRPGFTRRPCSGLPGALVHFYRRGAMRRLVARTDAVAVLWLALIGPASADL